MARGGWWLCFSTVVVVVSVEVSDLYDTVLSLSHVGKSMKRNPQLFSLSARAGPSPIQVFNSKRFVSGFFFFFLVLCSHAD